MAIFELNPSDWNSMLELMDKYGDEPLPFHGEDENGDPIIISVNPDNITTETFQSNGWTRTNIYNRDGYCEGLFDR